MHYLQTSKENNKALSPMLQINIIACDLIYASGDEFVG